MFDRTFYKQMRNWFAALTRFRRYALFLSTVAIPSVLAILAAVIAYNADLKPILSPVQVTVLIFAFLLGGGLFFFDENASLVFQKYANEVQRSESLARENQKQRTELAQLSAHINCLSVTSRAVESSILSDEITPDGLKNVARSLLENLSDQRTLLFAIRDDEFWNFAIYLKSEDGTMLTCLHHRRNFGAPDDRPREWPMGSGHVGLACQREGELLNDDVSSQEVFQGTGDLQRDYDRARYRSVASICIPDVNEGRAPIGVLVATSSEVGRYTQSNVQPLRDLAQSLGAILSSRGRGVG